MSRIASPLQRLLVLGTSLVCLVASARPIHADDSCVECHNRQTESFLRDPITQLAASAHSGREMSCSDCHGGRSDERTVKAHDANEGFLGRPSREAIPDMCGDCHSDPERLEMLGGDLPTDQLDLYAKSGHGRALARGNKRSAVCIDCHGAHDIRPDDDPLSLADPDSVLPTCAGCHSNAEKMTESGWPLDQARQWRTSVHGRAREDRNNEHAPTCNGCHDVHGGITGLDDVAACTRCHAHQELSFARSPHAKVFRRLGFASCVDCHGSHDIQKPDAKMLGIDRRSACRKCHTQGQPKVLQKIAELGVLRNKAHKTLRATQRILEESCAHGECGAEGEALLLEVGAARVSLSDAVHGFDKQGITHTVEVLATLEERAQSVRADRDRPQESTSVARPLLAVSGAALAFGIFVIVIRARRRATTVQGRKTGDESAR